MIYMNNMAVCNYIVCVLGAVIGGLIMQAAAAFPLEFTENGPGPGFWPFTLGAVLGAVSVLLLLYTFVNKTDLHGVKVQLSSTGNKRVYLMMGLLLCSACSSAFSAFIRQRHFWFRLLCVLWIIAIIR